MQSIAKKTEAMAATSSKDMSLQGLIKRMQPEIEKALPAVITPERFTRIVLSALSSNPQLATCTPRSFLAAMMTSAQLGMEVNTPLGQAYLIPYYNGRTKTTDCQFQLGYKGLLNLAQRSGELSDIYAYTVYENDEFEYELGLTPVLRHKPAKANRGAPAYFYAVFHLKSGGSAFQVMSVDDIKSHRDKFSKAAGKGFSPWDTNFEEMALKTVLKKLLKYAPMSTEFARAESSDGSVKTGISADMYDVPDETIAAEFSEPEEGPAAE